MKCLVLLLALPGIIPTAALAQPTEGAASLPEPGSQPGLEDRKPLRLSLADCLQLALENNQRRKISREGLRIAQAQHRQALSAWWPQLMFTSSYTLLDEDPNFGFPESRLTYPASTLQVPAQDLLLPAGAFGPGSPPGPVPLRLPGGQIQIPAQQIHIPEQKTTLMDRQTITGGIELKYPLYTGGLRRARIDQTRTGTQLAEQDLRRCDLDVVCDVKNYYYASLMTRKVHELARDTLARMEATLDLTESFYRNGSSEVDKTDYLRTKVAVEGLRAAVSIVQANHESARSALVNAMGLPWQTAVVLTESEIPFEPVRAELPALVGHAYDFSPDWKRINLVLKAAEAGIREARSGHLPKIMCFGRAARIWNDYDTGIMTDENKETWQIGLGVELPLFTGFRTVHQVREARARLEQLRHKRLRVEEGLALQVQTIFQRMNGRAGHVQHATEAAMTATENRELNVRAYRHQLVETEDVLESQLVESLMKAQRQKALYDHVRLQTELERIIGGKILQRLAGNSDS